MKDYIIDENVDQYPADDPAEPIEHCADCGDELTADDSEDHTDPDENRLCDTCYWESHFTCAHCGDRFHNDDESPQDPEWCDDCYGDYHSQCADCGSWETDDAAVHIDSGHVVCRSCYEDHYFHCEGCCNEFHCDDYGGDDYCRNCYDEREWPPDDDDPHTDADDDADAIHGYSCRDASLLGPFGPETEWTGVELEVEVKSGDRCERAARVLAALGRDFALTKGDGSLSHGFEIVSAPSDLETHRERWSRLLGAGATQGLASWDTSTCGMHVHVSRKMLSPLTLGKILVFVNDPDNANFVVAIAGRSGHQWAKRYHKRISDAIDHINVARVNNNRRLNGSDLRTHTDYHDSGRYEAVNLTNRHTVEFRIFKGTLNKASFFKNLEFVYAIVAYCKQAGCRSLRYKDFLGWLGKAPHTKQYPAMVGWLQARGLMPKPKNPPPMSLTSDPLPCPDPESDLP